MASLTLILLAVAAVVAIAAAALSHLFHGPLEKRIRRLAPEKQAKVLLIWALLPAFAGLGAVFIVTTPSVLAATGLIVDHCLSHGSHHHHLCLLHPGTTPEIPGAGALLALIAAGVILFGARQAWGEMQRRQTIKTLGTISRHHGRDRIRVLDTFQPFAATVGLVRPRVLLSRGLLDALSADQNAVVRAHEATHCRRRDPLRLALARLGAAMHVPATGRALFRALSLATEETADEGAAKAVGDRTRVAETLVRVVRLRPRTAGGVGIADGMLETRVRTLLEEPHRSAGRRQPWLPAVTSGLLAALLIASPQIHHGLETVLGHITG